MLAETSVLVTNVGSRSFRMAFLPPGAQVPTPPPHIPETQTPKMFDLLSPFTFLL